MFESKSARIAMLIFMAVVLVYTAANYARGQPSILMLGFAVFIAATTGTRIVQSLIEDYRNS